MEATLPASLVPALLLPEPAAPLPRALDTAPPPAPFRTAELPTTFELVLLRRWRLDELQLFPEAHAVLLPRLAALSAAALALHGLVVGALGARLPGISAEFAASEPWQWLPLAVPAALFGALCLCLPSFWFYTQLAGLDAELRLVALLGTRVQAVASVLLLGLLPFWAAVALASVLHLPAPPPPLVLLAGLALPFVAGLAGLLDLRRTLGFLVTRLPVTHERRGLFLQRLVLAWGAVYSAVAPVALWRLADAIVFGH